MVVVVEEQVVDNLDIVHKCQVGIVVGVVVVGVL